MTLCQRRDAFTLAFPANVASWPWLVQEQGHDVLYGVWVIGNDYRGNGYYGSYPPSFLRRVLALFPEMEPHGVLHVFAGALPDGEYWRLDVNPDHDPELLGSVYDVRRLVDEQIADDCFFHLVIADPPYSAADAKHYGTPMIGRGRALAALATVTAPGGYLCWLDTVWPMHTKREWRTVGRILVQRSTNHRVRLLSIFERVAS